MLEAVSSSPAQGHEARLADGTNHGHPISFRATIETVRRNSLKAKRITRKTDNIGPPMTLFHLLLQPIYFTLIYFNELLRKTIKTTWFECDLQVQ